MDKVSVRVVQSWFKRFQFGNFDVKDASRSSRPITGKSSMKSWKKLSKTGILAVMRSIRN